MDMWVSQFHRLHGSRLYQSLFGQAGRLGNQTSFLVRGDPGDCESSRVQPPATCRSSLLFHLLDARRIGRHIVSGVTDFVQDRSLFTSILSLLAPPLRVNGTNIARVCMR